MSSTGERDAAVAAGRRALASLREAQESLDSARGWGLVDIFGGGMLTSLVKRSRMDDASEALERAQGDLEEFAREFDGVERTGGVGLKRSDSLELFDVLLDNPLSDLLVQSRIEDARSGVESAIRRVTALLAELGDGARG